MAPSGKSVSIHGEALSILRSIPSQSVDHCITDPPYNMSKKKGLSWAFSSHVTMQENWDQFGKNDYFDFSSQWIQEVIRIVKPNGNLLIFGTYHNIYLMGFILQELDRKILNSIIWAKPNAQPNITCRMLTQSTEQVVWACNESNKKATGWTFNYKEGKKLNGGKQMRNYWLQPLTPRSERIAGHPTQKPEKLLERMVRLFSQPGDRILDPFAGVGTTGVAAKRHKREFILIEKEAQYVEAQKERFQRDGASRIDFRSSYPRRKSKGRSATNSLVEALK